VERLCQHFWPWQICNWRNPENIGDNGWQQQQCNHLQSNTDLTVAIYCPSAVFLQLPGAASSGVRRN